MYTLLYTIAVATPAHEAATLHSIVHRYAGAPIATRASFFLFLFVYLEMSLFPSIFCTIIAAFSYYTINSMERTSYVLSFRMVFFYLVTTGWIFDISLLFIYVRIQSITQIMYYTTVDTNMTHKIIKYGS